MSIEPGYSFNFARGGEFLDPRISFLRASTAMRGNRQGLLESVVANAPRFHFNPLTKVCEGLLVEGQRTNFLLRSQEFDNASWTKTTLTVTANSTTAPDGTTTAETLAVTGASGRVAQAVTITAGRGIALSVYAKANATSWLWVEVTDGTNAVACWFNLSAGTAGTNTAGAASNIFSQKLVEVLPNGWVRCMLETTTAGSTAFTASISAASADNTAPANTNSVFAWGAQLEAEQAGFTSASSYIPTTSATVTRSADAPYVTLDARLYNPTEGTIVADAILRPFPPQATGQSLMLGGLGDTFANTIYCSRSGAAALTATFISASASINIGRVQTLTQGMNLKIAMAWANNDNSFTSNGGAPSNSSLALIASAVRLGIGVSPFTTSPGATALFGCMRSFQYVPDRLVAADLQTLTA
jgi:hypothetical protein